MAKNTVYYAPFHRILLRDGENGKFFVFKTFFLISKMDKNKCPIFILKKKFQKMKIVFFWHFFWTKNLDFLTTNDDTTLCENGADTISFFSKKTHFFRFFRLFSENSKIFSGPFCPPKNEHHSFFRHFLKSQSIFNNRKFFSKKKWFFFQKKVALWIAP